MRTERLEIEEEREKKNQQLEAFLAEVSWLSEQLQVFEAEEAEIQSHIQSRDSEILLLEANLNVSSKFSSDQADKLVTKSVEIEDLREKNASLERDVNDSIRMLEESRGKLDDLHGVVAEHHSKTVEAQEAHDAMSRSLDEKKEKINTLKVSLLFFLLFVLGFL